MIDFDTWQKATEKDLREVKQFWEMAVPEVERRFGVSYEGVDLQLYENVYANYDVFKKYETIIYERLIQSQRKYKNIIISDYGHLNELAGRCFEKLMESAENVSLYSIQFSRGGGQMLELLDIFKDARRLEVSQFQSDVKGPPTLFYDIKWANLCELKLFRVTF
jgi:hypothetical protein